MGERWLRFVRADGATARVPATLAREIADELWDLALEPQAERGALTAAFLIADALRNGTVEVVFPERDIPPLMRVTGEMLPWRPGLPPEGSDGGTRA